MLAYHLGCSKDGDDAVGEKDTRRGYIDTDENEFSIKNIELLKKAQEEILWLLDRDYPIKNVVTFVGNRYMLSNRQRLALMRATSPTASVAERKRKEVSSCGRQVVSIDGFNLIITLEVALSGSTLIKCMDGTIRDLIDTMEHRPLKTPAAYMRNDKHGQKA